MYRDRYEYDRQTIFAECLRAWRVSPLARRIVKLISMFVVGGGIEISSDHKGTEKFLQEWSTHFLNRLDRKWINYCDEATRSGNLFFLCTADKATGYLYVRGVPADQVAEIITAENDVEQELAYKPAAPGKDPWPAYDFSNRQEVFMLHYATNQPVGVPWGEPDLAPMLPWIGRYSTWLEDRARLNHFRQAYVFVLKSKFTSEAARRTRERELNMNPPTPGSILVTDESETWTVMSPELNSSEAGEDGLALKKMIALGAGIPPHYLAEPEGSTRTTAEAAGTPTFRGLEQTQHHFLGIIEDLCRIAVRYRRKFSGQVNPQSGIRALGPDITERDNASLALAVSRIYPALSELFDREGINEKELLRVVYRMAGEVLPAGEIPTMKHRPLKPVSQQSARSGPADKGEDPTGVQPLT
jgi:hypothetical protein